MIQAISQETGLDEKESTRLLGIILGTIINSVTTDGKCYLGKFGVFHTKEQKAVKNLRHWNGKIPKRILFKPSLKFRLLMKSLSRVWN